jgi:hypothetical protein
MKIQVSIILRRACGLSRCSVGGHGRRTWEGEGGPRVREDRGEGGGGGGGEEEEEEEEEEEKEN